MKIGAFSTGAGRNAVGDRLPQKRKQSMARLSRHWAGKLSKPIGLNYSHTEKSVFSNAHWTVFITWKGFSYLHSYSLRRGQGENQVKN